MATLDELIAAEGRARELFDLSLPLVRPGTTEREISDGVAAIAAERFGVKKFWHKKIVRAGANTVHVYKENPPDLAIQADDIVFFDFGPVFEDWEADYGVTVVVGNDRRKQKLAADIERAWVLGRDYFRAHPEITGAELYRYVCELAREMGWEYGNVHCGHIVGKFPHEHVDPDDEWNHLYGTNDRPMRRPGNTGEPLQWILEIHFVDREAGYGGFQEALLY
ncbi:MAG: M24 family metallopeptidase [Kofleriaceae bacterium]